MKLNRVRTGLRLLVAAALAGGALFQPARPQAASELFFSEYIEGSSNNKALEIYNPTGAPVNLGAGGYNVQMFFNGSTTAGLTINLVGTVAAGDVFVVAQSSATGAILAQADQTNGAGWFNGDDAVVLRKGTTVIDVIGQVGFDPGSEWGSGLTSTGDNTLRRKPGIGAGDTDGSNPFDPAVEWDGFAQDTFDGLGSHSYTPPPPVINEFSASTAGTDVEYVEIHGHPGTDLSTYKVLEIEGDAGAATGTVDEVISLGTVGANGLYLVNLPANALENGTITLLLVKNFTGALNQDLDTDNDGVFDLTPWESIVDAVAVNDGGAGDLTYGAPVLGVAYDGLPFAPGGASRIPDGLDTDTAADWVRNDFDLAGIPGFPGSLTPGEAVNTPGAPNSLVPTDAAPAVASVSPANGATGVAPNANIVVTFSEPVNVSDGWFGFTCSVTDPVAATFSGGPTTFTIDPTFDFVAGETCLLTVFAANVSDQDAIDPPDTMVDNFESRFTIAAVDPCAGPFTPIPAIQGTGPAAAITGVVTTKGVVVGDYEGPSPALRGFYIQDPAGDGNPASSDGIFVFNGNNNHVNPGDLVVVTGTAAEFQDQTQISASTIFACGTGTVTPVDVTFPVASATFLEQYEGMLVRLPQTMYVTEHFQLGRFGQVVLSSGGRLQQPTDVVLPGAPANAMQAANTLNRIILDDPLQNQNPDPIVFARGGLPLSASNTLRGGDTATGIVGVMAYTWGGNADSPNAYRVRPVGALGGAVNFEAVNQRPATPPAVGGTLRVASFNLLNYYNTFSGCTNGVGGDPIGCRGAENTLEFERQAAKTVEALLATGADVIGLIEVENDGYGSESAIQDLVDRLNEVAGAGTWAFIDADAATGFVNVLGSDGIKVALIYKPAVATPVGQTAVLNTGAFGLYVLADGRVQGRNRPSLAQAFEVANGARATVVVNHLVSKGAGCALNVSPIGPDPDTGDGQGACNLTRLESVKQLDEWLNTDPTGTGDPDRLLVGDFNAYTMEDPLRELETRSYANLAKTLLGSGSYTYVFDGQWGSLDHALASTSLEGQVAGVGVFHINADEPSVLDYNTNFKSAGQLTSLYAPDAYRASDHDPIVVGLDLRNDAPVITSISPPVTIYEGQSTVLEALGYDPDGGAVTYAWDLDDDGTFETSGQTAVFWGDRGVGTFTVRVRVTDQSGLSATASTTVTVVFNWTGFFPPIKNLPAANAAKAGSAVPAKFSLGGDQGLDIFATGFPVSLLANCATGEPLAVPGSATVNPGRSSLTYDPRSDVYTYVWKTDKAWAGTCRLLVVTLVDGTSHEAFFRFR